jgi:uncharacterized protein YnzC (UPF0291/DUF896 family)
MVSDIVLLKELPEYIRNSVSAYVGCISGAILKKEYINAIKEAGFQKVKIVDETTFPVELMVNDSTAQVLMKKNDVTLEKLKEIGITVVSIKVEGKKESVR